MCTSTRSLTPRSAAAAPTLLYSNSSEIIPLSDDDEKAQ